MGPNKHDRNSPSFQSEPFPPRQRQKRRLEKAKEMSPPVQPGTTLVDLPVELWFEVFEYASSLDLLRLTRTCKILRRCLMRPSAATTWKRVRENDLNGFPACPPDTDEPSWASLALDNFCHFCGGKAKRPTFWARRLRLCGDCAKDPEFFMDTPQDWCYICPPLSVLHGFSWLTFSHNPSVMYLREDVSEFREIVDSFGHNKALAAEFIARQISDVQNARELEKLCIGWQERYHRRLQQNLRVERDRRMRVRRQEIEKKLCEVGYGGHLEKFKKMFPRRFERHAYVAEGGNLTEKDWNRIQPTLIELMEEEDKKRRQQKHDDSIAELATRPEFAGRRVSRSMFKALKK